MNEIRSFLSESLDDQITESKDPKNSEKIPSSCTLILSIGFIIPRISTALVELLRNYTHKSFITFFTIGLTFILCMILEFARLIITTYSSSTNSKVFLDYCLGFALAVCMFSISSCLLFLFWKVLQQTIEKTTWRHNCLRLFFLIVDVVTALKYFSAIRAKRGGINYILMATYIKAGSLAILAYLFLWTCVYKQHNKKRFRSLLKIKFSAAIFLVFHSILIMVYRLYGMSWQASAIVCCLSYISFAVWVLLPFHVTKEDSGLVTQIKIAVLLITLYVIAIFLFLVVHYDMDCSEKCGQRGLPSTARKNLHTLDTTKINGDSICKINQTRSQSYIKKDDRFGNHPVIPMKVTDGTSSH